MATWPEIERAKVEKRRELVVRGNEELKKKMLENDGELPSEVFNLTLLNFLEFNDIGLESLSEKIANLTNLTQLLLRQNQLCHLPKSICQVKCLKILDFFGNCLTELPENVGDLTNLHTLNLSNNQLECLPDSFSSLNSLAVLDISQNKFKAFPKCLYEGTVCDRLAELYVSHNEIEDVDDCVDKIVLLKILDISNNQLKELTQGLGKCLKLKQTNFKKNPLKDRRLKKLIDQDGSQKSILDYIRTKGRKISATSQANGQKESSLVKGSRKKLKSQKLISAIEDEEKALVKHTIDVLRLGSGETPGSKPFRVIMSEEAKQCRPYIVGCVVRHLRLDRGDNFKRFISLQTKLHDEICEKRTVATIATHDMKALPNSVVHYDAQDATTFKIRPLGRKTDMTAMELYEKLCKEAEHMRKEKKRSQVSGIYKYLSLLKNKENFAFVRRDSDGCVISLPPLTNCDVTKISSTTADLFIEVTGTKSLDSCKRVLDGLLQKMVELRFYSYPPKEEREHDFYDDSSDEDIISTRLVVQQVRVEDDQGQIRVVYPSRTDLTLESKEIKIERVA
ncbi:leucine-rich repeat-containing protein 47-like [Clavelina lepadiformis]|uniref:leucine-rich repeat-containing protein 47-like n=1 Tax=Clavelina lepadiformis TaxID=159417 RepID=UPI004043040B